MRSRLLVATLVLLCLSFAAVVVRLAWLGDDAYITLRTVELMLAGHGPVWNVGERAQTYTHPLWMLLLAAGRALTGEHYYTTLALGAGLSFATVALLLRRAGSIGAACTLLAVLLASRSFCDFTTSGLENPLVFLLLALFAREVTSGCEPAPRLLRASLLAGLLLTTRMDLAVLVAPSLLQCVRGVPLGDALRRLMLGTLPFTGWLLFATWYYGTPFPVTAYAKAFNTGIPAGELLQQGMHYFVYVATHDPATLLAIAAAATIALWRGELRARPLAIGALLYCAYTVKVGGDFMSGRFCTPPLLLALAAAAPALRTLHAGALVAVAGIATAALFAVGTPSWMHAPDDQPPENLEHYHGIIDERKRYEWIQGLLSPTRSLPTYGLVSVWLQQKGRVRPVVMPYAFVGRFGYEAGELVHVCDSWLCDPLLMRLPMDHTRSALAGMKWRIGHFIRRIPEGYLESLATGENRIHHPGLRRYYDALRLAIRGPLNDGARLRAVFGLLTGAYDDDLRDFIRPDGEYFVPPRLPVALADLQSPPPVGTWWVDSDRIRLVYHGGIAIALGGVTRAASVTLLLHCGTSYTLRFRRGGQEVGSVVVPGDNGNAAQGVQQFPVAVPPTVGEFDELWLDGRTNAELVAAIGGLAFGD